MAGGVGGIVSKVVKQNRLLAGVSGVALALSLSLPAAAQTF